MKILTALLIILCFQIKMPAQTNPQLYQKEQPYLIRHQQQPCLSFPGCEDIRDKAEREKCALEKFMIFFQSNLKYPEWAIRLKVEGIVIVQFTIEKDGSVKDPKIIKDLKAGCGEEVLRVVNQMPNFNPGPARGRPRRCKCYLPVRFVMR